MLKPAYAYKEELEKKFAEVVYNDDYFFYMGYPHGHEVPGINVTDYYYQWAIIGKGYEQDSWDTGDGHVIYCDDETRPIEKVIGYFAYQIQPEADTAMNFGLYSFDKGNPLVGHDVFRKMVELLLNHRRLEWRVIGGNPVEKNYDWFCKKYGGNKVTLHSAVKDPHGGYRDEHIYEILRDA